MLMKIEKEHKISVLYTGAEPCSYFPDKALWSETMLLHSTRYDRKPLSGDHLRKFTKSLIPQGFLDGGLTPKFNGCATCKRCFPVRIVIDDFTPSRSQKRILKRNNDLTTTIRSLYENDGNDLILDDEHYKLFHENMTNRHPNGGFARMSQNNFEASFEPFDLVVESRNAAGKLLCASILTAGDDYLYGINFYYDTEESKRRSLGKFTILAVVDALKGSPTIKHFYLGSLAQNSPKLGYKGEFSGLEAMTTNGWVPYQAEKKFETPDYEAILPQDLHWPYRTAHKNTNG